MKNFKVKTLLYATLFLLFLFSVSACAGQNKIYTVIFDGNGGKLVSGEETQYITGGNAAEAPVYERENFVFDGWDISFGQVTENLTVKAKWIRTYTVTFDLNGGSIVSGELIQTIKEGESAVAPICNFIDNDVERRFGNWSVDFSKITNDITVKALWQYKVIFDGNGGTFNGGGNESQYVTEGDSIGNPPIYIKGDNYQIGWSKDASSVSVDGSETCITEDTVLYAVWDNISEGLLYVLNQESNTYSISGLGDCKDTDLVIPLFHNGKFIEEILPEAFQQTNITSLVLRGQISKIGEKAFYNCPDLESIVISNSITYIGEGAFALCNNLNNVTISKEIPPELYENNDKKVFTISSNFKISVPSDLVVIYKNSWVNYSNYIVAKADN